jgi:hypothetical protein
MEVTQNFNTQVQLEMKQVYVHYLLHLFEPIFKFLLCF